MAKFDQIWVDNRFRYRKTLRGSRMKLHEATGYLESTDKRGFNGEMKSTFIERFRVCSNFAAVTRSVNIDVQSVYDAIAVDKKFREAIIACNQVGPNGIDHRTKQLNNELVKLAASEKNQVILNLGNRLDKYK